MSLVTSQDESGREVLNVRRSSSGGVREREKERSVGWAVRREGGREGEREIHVSEWGMNT